MGAGCGGRWAGAQGGEGKNGKVQPPLAPGWPARWGGTSRLVPVGAPEARRLWLLASCPRARPSATCGADPPRPRTCLSCSPVPTETLDHPEPSPCSALAHLLHATHQPGTDPQQPPPPLAPEAPISQMTLGAGPPPTAKGPARACPLSPGRCSVPARQLDEPFGPWCALPSTSWPGSAARARLALHVAPCSAPPPRLLTPTPTPGEPSSPSVPMPGALPRPLKARLGLVFFNPVPAPSPLSGCPGVSRGCAPRRPARLVPGPFRWCGCGKPY